jgi:hypothetical protein
MMLSAWRPTAIAGVILNDIGPIIEPQGWVRITGYVGKLPVPRNFEEGADILRWWFDAQFPKLAPQDWIAFAQRTWCQHGGRLVPDYDLKLARTLQEADPQRLPTLCNHFDGLARVPLMVIRGARFRQIALQQQAPTEPGLEVSPSRGARPVWVERLAMRTFAALVTRSVSNSDGPGATRYAPFKSEAVGIWHQACGSPAILPALIAGAVTWLTQLPSKTRSNFQATFCAGASWPARSRCQRGLISPLLKE